MNYERKYQKYKAKYLEAKSIASNSRQNQVGGNEAAEESSSKDFSHVAKSDMSITKIGDIMNTATVSGPENPLQMPSNEDVSNNEELKKFGKKNRSQSRSLLGADIYVIQPDYSINPSKAIAKFLETSQFYGGNNFFTEIYNYYVNYGMNFINNSIRFDSHNSTILQEDPINGIFVFQANNGFIYQVNAVNIGVVGLVGTIRAIIWSWAQSLYAFTNSNKRYLNRIVRKINKHPELQQAAGVTSYSGTTISYAPGYMDSEEWYYMMLIGFLTRAQGYFLMTNGADIYTYYMITSINQI